MLSRWDARWTGHQASPGPAPTSMALRWPRVRVRQCNTPATPGLTVVTLGNSLRL
jgi:hypothetical protein